MIPFIKLLESDLCYWLNHWLWWVRSKFQSNLNFSQRENSKIRWDHLCLPHNILRQVKRSKKASFIVPHHHLLASFGSLAWPVKYAWIMISFRTSFRIWSFLDWLCVATVIHLLYWALPPRCHGATIAGTSKAGAGTWSSFLLKTLCHCNATMHCDTDNNDDNHYCDHHDDHNDDGRRFRWKGNL